MRPVRRPRGRVAALAFVLFAAVLVGVPVPAGAVPVPLGREVLDLGVRPVVKGGPLAGAYDGLALDDGGLVLAGEAPGARGPLTVLARISRGGALLARRPLDAIQSVNAVLGRPDGRLLVVGIDTRGHVELLGRTAEGIPDRAFGSGGTVVTTLHPACPGPVCASAALDGTGAVTVASGGTGGVGDAPLAEVARFDAAGRPDPGFGGGRPVVLRTSTADVHVLVGAAADRGAVVLEVGSGGRGTLRRLTAAGTPDTGFGSGGSVTLPRLDATFVDVRIAASGRIDVALEGEDGHPDRDGVLIRYAPDGRSEQRLGLGSPDRMSFPRVFQTQDGGDVVAGSTRGGFRVERFSPAGERSSSRVVRPRFTGAVVTREGRQFTGDFGESDLDPILLDAAGGLVFAGATHLARYSDIFGPLVDVDAGTIASRFAIARTDVLDRPDRAFGALATHPRVTLGAVRITASRVRARIASDQPASCTIRVFAGHHRIADGDEVLLTARRRHVTLRRAATRKRRAQLSVTCRSLLGLATTASGTLRLPRAG